MKEYIFSIIACAISCGIVAQLAADSRKKDLMHLICGIVLTISVYHPLTDAEQDQFLSLPELNVDSADYYIEAGEKAALEARAACIKASSEAYILNKAKERNAEIMVQISLNEDLIPVFAEVKGDVAHDIKAELQRILTRDLGIPKENQQWIWNQENNSS